MSEFHIEVDYPYACEKVWRALTDPAVVPLWTTTGKGGKPVGFRPEVGCRFQFVAKPMPGWKGVVECEVKEVKAPSLLVYTWQGDEGDDVTQVSYRLEPRGEGTRFTWDHIGFTGVGGMIVSRLLASVRRKMLTVSLPKVLAEMREDSSV